MQLNFTRKDNFKIDNSPLTFEADIKNNWLDVKDVDYFPCYLKQTYLDSARAMKFTGFNLALSVRSLRAVDPLGNPALC